MRLALLLLVAAGLFALGVSDAVYEVTSPSAMAGHVWLRKTYSIGAFALVGGLFVWALRPAAPRGSATLAVALYSAALEVAQWLHGSHEGLRWNAIDVACGALGGYVGAVAAEFLGSRERSRR